MFARTSQLMAAADAWRYAPLVDANTWRRMSRIAEQLDISTHTVCFECRLATTDGRADWACNLFPGEAARTLLHRVTSRNFSAPGWLGVRRFVETWGHSGSGLSVRIPFICLAFDLDEAIEGSDVAQAPCVSLCVDPAFFIRRVGLQSPFGRPEPAELIEVASECTTLLTGAPLEASPRDQLTRYLDAGAEACHFSLMLPRPGSPSKLDVRLPSEHLTSFLAQTGWQNAREVAASVLDYVPWGGPLQLNLPLNPVEAPLLEVELFADPPPDRLRPQKLLQRLVDEKRACEVKVATLRQIGDTPRIHVDDRDTGHGWYLKLRFEGNAVRDAKAYVGLVALPSKSGAA